MKSPAELKIVLKRQWDNAVRREARLLRASDAWPVVLSIGRPSAQMLRNDLDRVKRHVEAWRQVKTGEVVWEQIPYRATAAPVDIPVSWKLRRPTEWMVATGDARVRQEFEAMSALVKQTEAIFHSLLVRRRSLWAGKPEQEIVQAVQLAAALAPGYAQGRPLRTLALEGIDTKFFERHAQLITTLLDVRFDGEVSQLGLENFLGAAREGEHWLLVVDLDGSLLPFKKSRVRSSELRQSALPGERLLIVENEASQHQLPGVTGTIAVLGAGFDLGWTEGEWLASKEVAYWGDIDTWGLQFLAKARTTMPHLEALMMTAEVYDQFLDLTVAEPVVAGTASPTGLTVAEQQLYIRLLQESRGRLEQEFLPLEVIRETIQNWWSTSVRRGTYP